MNALRVMWHNRGLRAGSRVWAIGGKEVRVEAGRRWRIVVVVGHGGAEAMGDRGKEVQL